MNGQTNFLLGVGAQKSGTTWVHSQLKKHPSVCFGWKKEISLWGSLWDRNLASRQPRKLGTRLRRKLFDFPNGKRIPHYGAFKHVLAHEYFSEFRARAGDHIQVVGDITPHYAAISPENFSFLRKKTVEYGFRPRVLFGMRDPVSRVISGVLHANRRLTHPSNDDLVQLIAQTFSTYPVRVRTDYASTIRSIESVFEPGEIHYYFYEELFSERTFRGITDWLGIEKSEADFSAIVGGSSHKVEIPDSLRAEIREYYDSVYVGITEKFGEERVRALWSNF